MPPNATDPSPEFLAVFREHADRDGMMTFARFMELALYHPTVGYYRSGRARIGYGKGTDFFTATSSGRIFGELVCAACVSLLGERDPRTHTFVEIGAEPFDSAQGGPGGVLAGVVHPFAAVRTVRVGDPIALGGDCVVFSNELFDAQPCVRTVFRNRRWHELGVQLENGRLTEIELLFDPARSESASLPDGTESRFATASPPGEGYRFDRPIAAAELATQIAAQPWRGLFVAIDYGKTFRELTGHTPGGTVRAYYRHTQSNDVLARPGEQDLTCHVCWDWLADALRQQGFAEPVLEFQESFFIRRAAQFIETAMTAEAAHFSQRKLALMQLLHGAHLGQKFQVLHAVR